ncbi:hypothetical protein [Nocardioides litoris]|uniref:hypothetical protein n=1 Tax=Nocardioides litoris TaxID=1926648 RepID=UPI00111F9DA1|nr:hypothetical protein [Nocardioides litoris]
MNPVLRALASGALVALAAGGSVPAAHATTTPQPTAPAEQRVVFTGTFVRPPTTFVDDGRTLRRYQVEVELVYGEGDVDRRVTVTSPVALERCRTGSQGGSTGSGGSGGAQQEQAPGNPTPSSPTTTAPAEPGQGIDKQLRLFATTPDDGRFAVAGCDGVTLATATVLNGLGDGRPPGREGGTADGGTGAVPDVGFLCPDTRDAADLDDAASCDALAPGDDVARMAAPGLAILIVGGLGLLVARRLGRQR